MALRVAVVGGPMYDGLYSMLPADAEIVVHADHPTLNRTVAEMLAAGERIDVLSTHSKYAPSQASWLRPLDRGLAAGQATKAVELCTFEEALLCVPRNIDVRVMWVRRDVVDPAPATWADLLASDAVFGFTGRESGLFGTYFEYVSAHGGQLFDGTVFDADLRPTLDTALGEEAIDALCQLAARAPDVLPTWHYDEVDAALARGDLAMSATWPGGFGPLRDAPVYDRLDPHPYLSGPAGLRSYGGCHGWAIPTTCGDVPAALALLERLSSFDAHALDARAGTACARVDAFAAVEAVDATDARRLEITRATISDGLITYPPLPRFPAVEDAAWSSINAALRGELTPAQAAKRMQSSAEHALARG
jgi:multiple sugar transport system substrate-binding protein